MQYNSSILIVDDEPVIRDILEALLLGYQLFFATNGPEALRIAAECSPDIILLDVMMPDMDGFTVCQKLRANPQLADVPIVLVTALDDRDSRLRGIEAGADDFLSKPFDRAELRARVQTITRLNRYRRLVAAKEQFAWVVEHANDGYIVVNNDDQIQYANPRAQRYLGIHEPVTGTETFLSIAQRQYHCEPDAAWQGWPATIADVPYYLVLPESAGTNAFWLRVDLLELPPGAGPGRLIRLHDVTAHMALQRDMRSFHGMVSHKLRTPLVGMTTSMEILAHHCEKLSRTEITEIALVAERNVRRLRATIEDILQYVHLPRTAQTGSEVCLSQLHQIIAGISASLRLPSLSVTIPSELEGSYLTLSQRAIEQILWEILENSQKFHPNGTPSIDILVLHNSNHTITITVRDDGVTLTSQQLAQAWTHYYQGEAFFTGEAAGVGLGLSLVATLVWGSGGSCRISNRTDRPGVQVELTLPLEIEQPETVLDTQHMAAEKEIVYS